MVEFGFLVIGRLVFLRHGGQFKRPPFSKTGKSGAPGKDKKRKTVSRNLPTSTSKVKNNTLGQSQNTHPSQDRGRVGHPKCMETGSKITVRTKLKSKVKTTVTTEFKATAKIKSDKNQNYC
jgi:hypothetical protein